jgi:hypothetical protein
MKERLQQIDDNSNVTHYGDGRITVEINQKDYEWLIEQAEKAERLKKEFEFKQSIIDEKHNLQDKVKQLEKELIKSKGKLADIKIILS